MNRKTLVLPAVVGLRWSCSMEEVDWAGAGYEGRALRWLNPKEARADERQQAKGARKGN